MKHYHIRNISKLLLSIVLCFFSFAAVSAYTYAALHDNATVANNIIAIGNLKMSVQLYEGESTDSTDRLASIGETEANTQTATGFRWFGCRTETTCAEKDQVYPKASKIYTLIIRNLGRTTGVLDLTMDQVAISTLQSVPGYETVSESLWHHTKFSKAIGRVATAPVMPLTTTLTGFATLLDDSVPSMPLIPTNPALTLKSNEAVIILLYFEIEDLDNSYNTELPTYGFAVNLIVSLQQSTVG